MTAGIEGTGPYAELKELRMQIKRFKYELALVNEGHKRQYAASTYQKLLKDTKARIKTLNQKLNSEKLKS